MKMRCPYCGSDVQEKEFCGQCTRSLSTAKDFWKKSIVYYNAGYKAAKSRNLSLAKKYLRKSILASRYAVDARNLLGLVYYETGEVGDALKEWIISSALQKEDNVAKEYIAAMQADTKKLEHWHEAIRLYNESLEYLKQKNTDMAIIRLKKAVSLNTKFVRARVMLGLCYMYDKQYHKANDNIKKALLIDNGDKEALTYYYELSREDTESCEPYQKTYEPEKTKPNHVTISAMHPNVILDRQALLTRAVLYFVMGVVSVIIIYTYLIIPSRLQTYKDQIADMTEMEQTMQDKMKEVSTKYEAQVTDLEDTKEKLESEVSNYELQLGVLTQKERLASAQHLNKEGKYIESAEKIYNIASSKLDEVDAAAYEALKTEVYPKANEQLYNEGLSSYNQSDFIAAIANLEKILLYDPEEKMTRKALLYLGCSEMENGNRDNAKRYFSKLVSEYSESYEAREASRKLEEIAS